MICFKRAILEAVFIMGCVSIVAQTTQPVQPVFEHLTTNNGLTHNTVRSFCQDDEGFMWIGTMNGLNRFDGINFREYRHYSERYYDPVRPILFDTAGNLWFGEYPMMYDKRTEHYQSFFADTDSGLIIIDGSEDFTLSPDGKIYMALYNEVFSKNIYDKDSVLTEVVASQYRPDYKRITRVKSGPDLNLWVGTDTGIFIMYPDRKITTYFSLLKYPEQKYVNDFIFDNSGNLWVIFPTSIVKYDFETGNTENLRLPLPGNPVLTRIYQTRNGLIWVGTSEQGLFYMDEKSKQFKTLLEQTNISVIYEDQSGRLWIGSESSGLYIYDSLMNYFNRLPLNIEKKSIRSFHCDVILNDHDKGLWIASRSYGLLYYNFKTQETTVVDSSNNMIDLIYEDIKGRIWYNHLNYLLCYDPVNKTIRKIKHPVPDQFPVLNRGNTLTKIVLFNNHMIISSDFGQLYSFNPVNEEFTLVYNNPGHLIRSMLVTDDKLYAGVYYLGIVVFDKTFTPVDTVYHNDMDKGLISHSVMIMYQDKFDTLWIGGYGGLSKYNSETGQFENKIDFHESATILTSVMEDNNGNLWIGSSDGIIEYDRAGNSFILFDSSNGVPPGRFFVNSVARTAKGIMYFGGNNGIVFFDPAKVSINTSSPPIVLTEFQISGSGKKTKKHYRDLIENINYLSDIHLKYFENSFTVRYAALNYTSPIHNQYKYMLKGLENKWNLVGNQSQATYTDIRGGKYTFYVCGSNNDGIWNPEPRELEITVDKPPLMTNLAISLYIIVLIMIILIIYEYNLRRIRLQHQLELKSMETETLVEINEAKSKFFTNISHEFRTPITLILDPATRMITDKSVSGKNKKYLKLIIGNAKRLMLMVNQILDLSKLKSGQLKIKIEQVDFRSFIMPIFSSFKSRAESLNLKYELIFEGDDFKLWIDKEKMRYVFINLISNAFKFCPEGKIKIEVIPEPDKVFVRIEDTGIGISSEHIDKIFDEYYQVNNPCQQNLGGTGIGLALVREYLSLHHAFIEVQSEVNKGTVFTVILLKGNSHFNCSEVIPHQTEIEHDEISASSFPGSKRKEDGSSASDKNKYTVLFIEDDPDIITYLSEAFSDRYNIITALNGAQGYERTLKYCPDVVVCDVMMPVMDGYTYCEKIKKDERISHIPVILLTARAEHEDKIKGLNIGADDYLEKPFSLDELELRIRYHIERFIKLRSMFMRDLKFKSGDEISPSVENKFLQQALSHIEKYYNDDQFGVEKMSQLMSMSRIHLYRKIKKMTGNTPNELIRNYRLRKARILLLENSANVTEACFKVGFNNLSYFSKCFFKFYGKHPSSINEA